MKSPLLILCVASATSAAQTDSTCFRLQDLSWSPDSKTLFYSAMEVKCDWSDYSPDKWSVYSVDVTTGIVTKISSASLYVTSSPDGSAITTGKNGDIYAVNLKTRKETRLTDDLHRDFAPAWSPDGNSIAFNSDRSGTVEIWIMNADGTRQTQVTRSGSFKSYNPAWSPDGSWIAFYLEKGDHKDQVHVIRPDGSGMVNLTNDEFNNIFPGWTPDGRILYGQERGEKTATMVVNPVTKEKEHIYHLESFFARYSPDGTLIAAIQEEGTILLTMPDGETRRVDPKP